jgi:putative transposase
MKANQAAHSIPTMCRVLGVSASGYYAWQRRAASARTRQDVRLLEHIRAFHRQSRGTYGTPRIHRDLRAAGVRVGRKRVARLLKQAGLRGVSRRTWGWAMATHLRTRLVVAALDMALTQRRPHGVIHHSDQGCQYTAIEFGRRCREAHVRPSMGSVGDCYDNAMCESFFATLECELLDRVTLRSAAEARTVVFDFIEGWYNPRRRHSALDYVSPVEFEQTHPPAAGAPGGTEAAA